MEDGGLHAPAHKRRPVSGFLDMGGHAATVWPAYGVTLGILVALLLVSLRSSRRRHRELAHLERALREKRDR